jgi:Zn-dependent peptidase ImmA (M78 family)
MHECIRQKIYNLFAKKGVLIEVNETVDAPNFCCLKIRYQPVRGMTLIIGKFTDDVLEVLLIAHELGHILHYENLSREDAEAAYCAIFASNHRGLENISPESKQLVIGIEKKASEYAVALLRSLDCEETILSRAQEMYGEWIKGYVKKARLSEVDAIAL